MEATANSVPLSASMVDASAGGPAGGDEKAKASVEAKRDAILQQIMTPDARERLNRVKLVKPDKADQVAAMLIQMAQRKQLVEKVDGERLKAMLAQIGAEETKATTKITIQRKKRVDDDDDEDYSHLA